MKNAAKIILINLLFIIIILALYETFLVFLIRNPNILKKFPMKLRNTICYLYNNGDRRVIQFSPNCAQFDNHLGYTLKPGHCVFTGKEFTNEYYINNQGLRDDELSLDHPPIIVTGDSFAMGWGVDQKQTFPQNLHQKTGLRVLNAAISSYGTAREMIMLRRIPTDRLQYLIIQYCGNDYEENLSYFLKQNKLHTMNAEKYQKLVEMDNQNKAYFFGKYLLMKINKKISEIRQPRKAEQKPINMDDVDLFINAIVQSNLDLKNVQIVVFIMNGRIAADNKAFPAALKERIIRNDYPSYIREMIVLDFSNILKDEHFYVLDDHMNRDGHVIVADALYQTIAQRGISLPRKSHP
jgi:lysophospholipase L1-like esterase